MFFLSENLVGGLARPYLVLRDPSDAAVEMANIIHAENKYTYAMLLSSLFVILLRTFGSSYFVMI